MCTCRCQNAHTQSQQFFLGLGQAQFSGPSATTALQFHDSLMNVHQLVHPFHWLLLVLVSARSQTEEKSCVWKS